MAIVYGPVETGQSLGIEITQTNDGTNATIVVDFWHRSTYPMWDTSNTLHWNGDLSGSRNNAIYKTSAWTGTQKIHSVSVSRPLGNAPYNFTINAYITGVSVVADGRIDASATLQIPAKPYLKPRPPLNPVLTQNSDTSHTLAWTPNYTSAAEPYPWRTVHIERWAANEPVWKEIASVHWSTESFTDTTTQPNNEYDYRVRSKNTAGFSDYADVPSVYTTPAPPNTVSYGLVGNALEFTWTSTALVPVTTKIYRSVEGGAWTLRDTVATNSWVDTSFNIALKHEYRFVHEATKGGTIYTSAPRQVTVRLALAPPYKPVLRYPVGVNIDAADGAIFGWDYQDSDGSAQTSFEIQVREAGTGAWESITGRVYYSPEAYVLGPDVLTNGLTYEWRVRTWGAHSDPSVWSNAASFTAAPRPVTTILEPVAGVYVRGPELRVVWAFHDPSGYAQSRWEVQVKNADGVLVARRSGNDARSSLSFGNLLEDNTHYEVWVRLTNDRIQTSNWAVREFDVRYQGPPTPIVDTSWDSDAGRVTIEITNPPSVTEPEFAYQTVQRFMDGQWVTLATHLPAGTTVTDLIPPLGSDVLYRVLAHSAMPSSVEVQFVVSTKPHAGWIWLTSTADLTRSVRMHGSISQTVTRERKVQHFAGRPQPVVTMGSKRTRTIDVSAKIHADSSTVDQIEALADSDGVLVYRDPAGRHMFVTVTGVTSSHKRVREEISLNLTEVEQDERRLFAELP